MVDTVNSTNKLKSAYNQFGNKLAGALRKAFFSDVSPGEKILAGGSTPTRAALKAFAERYRFADMLPYESYDKTTALFYNEDTVGFALLVSPSTSLTERDLTVLNSIYTASHKPGTIIQTTLIADHNVERILDTWAANINHSIPKERLDIAQAMASNRVEYYKKAKWQSFFSDQPCLPRNFHLVLSVTLPVPEGVAPIDVQSGDIEHLLRLRDSISGTLRSAKMIAQVMSADDLIYLLDGLLNPSSQPRPKLTYDENALINDQIISSETAFYPDAGVSTIESGDEFFSVIPFHVRQFPLSWAGWANGDLIGNFRTDALRIPCSFVATLTISVPDAVAIKSKVKFKRTRATQMVDTPVGKYATQWKDRKADWEYTERRVDQGDALLDAFYQIVLVTKCGMEQEAINKTTAVYATLGWVINRSRFTPKHALLGALPMGITRLTNETLKKFKHYRSRLSWTCTNTTPWIAEWKGTKTPLMMLIGRRGQLSFFDNFDNTKGNYNIAITAKSGGGKSFLMAEYISRMLGMGGQMFVIDAGHSYRPLNKLYGGTYIDFGDPQFSPCVNPFSYIAERAEGISDKDYLEYLDDQTIQLKLILGQMASPTRELTKKQDSALEESIQRVVKKAGREGNPTFVRDELVAMFEETGDNTCLDLSKMLYSYTDSGVYGRYFTGPANIDLANRFVVLDLDALNAKAELQKVVLLLLMMRINHAFYLSSSKSMRKGCVIDEAWRLLGSDRSAQFIEEGYRVARKHGGFFGTITQYVPDYFKSNTTKACYACSDYKIYLPQDPDTLAEAEKEKYVDNSSGLVDVLRSLETQQSKYSELAIKSPDGLSVCRLVVDPVSEKLFSTQAAEAEFIRKKQLAGVPIFEAINELLKTSKGR